MPPPPSQGFLDQEAMDIFLAEVGYQKGSDLSYEQFASLVTMLDENMRAMGDGVSEQSGEGDSEEDEKVDLDDAELEEVAREIFDELRGKAKGLPIKAFKAWDEVRSAVAAGILSEKTLGTLISEVAAPRASDLAFDEFKELVQLLDEAADVAMGASEGPALSGAKAQSSIKGPKNSSAKVASTLDDVDEDDGEVWSQEEDQDEPTPEELETFAREVYDELKSAKTGKLTVKSFRAWEGMREVLETGELSQEDLTAVLEAVDGDNKGSLSFAQFRKAMDMIEERLDDSSFDMEDDEDEVEVAVPAKKGTSKTDGGKGFSRDDAKSKKASAKAQSSDDEALEVSRNIRCSYRPAPHSSSLLSSTLSC